MTAAATMTEAAAMITKAAAVQGSAEPRPEDFFALARAAEQVLDAVYELNVTLGSQLGHYAGQGRLRPSAGRTPEQVLAAATDYGRALHDALYHARKAASLLAGEFARPAFLPSPGVRPGVGVDSTQTTARPGPGTSDDDDLIIVLSRDLTG